MTGDTRESSIKLPIPGDLEWFKAFERLSQPFEIDVDVLCKDVNADFFPLLGEPISIQVVDDGGPVRWFHGLLLEAEYDEDTPAGHRHSLKLRPWLWMLTRNLDYKIFQDKTAVDIIKEVFESRGCSDVEYKLKKSYQPRPYCVQYRESDFNFISRLMEDEGISYYFKHAVDKHTMVLCDDRSSYLPCPYGGLKHITAESGRAGRTDHFWAFKERVSTGGEAKVTLRDWNFLKSDAPLEADYSASVTLPTEKAEVYDFPGGFDETADGKPVGEVILKSARRQRRLYIAEGNALKLACGSLVSLADHFVIRLLGDYLITAMTYEVNVQTYRSGTGDAEPATVAIEATPAANPWLPPMVTPHPVARGPETAVVTGTAGEKIYTEENGQVKVRFPWDRSGSAGEKSTCWLRVSHHSAGEGFGHVVLPRIGQEVIVDFLDGDPDRPIVTGRVYNSTHSYPQIQSYNSGVASYKGIKLPANKTVSAWMSRTVGAKGDYTGALKPAAPPDPGYNMIMMEDASGQEALYFHAQRNMGHIVRLDAVQDINRDYVRGIGRDRTTTVERNDDTTITKGNQTLTISQGDQTETIKTGKRTTTIKGDDAETVQTGDVKLTVQQGTVTHHVNVGDYNVTLDKGSVSITAPTQIQLKCGASTITMTPSSISIKTVTLTSEGQAMHTMKGAMTEVDGTGMVTVKGGVVMIN